MAERQTRQLIADKAIVHVEMPLLRPRHQIEADRNFELPTVLYALTALGYLGFLGLTALAFGNPGLIVPMGIFVIFIAMFFGVPAMWMRMQPAHADRAKSWSRFMSEGIETYTGRLSARQASVQVLILPAIVLLWGVAVVTVAALV